MIFYPLCNYIYILYHLPKTILKTFIILLPRFVQKLENMAQEYKSPKFWIMLEKEFKDDQDKLVSYVFKYDSGTGNLNYCGTISLQV